MVEQLQTIRIIDEKDLAESNGIPKITRKNKNFVSLLEDHRDISLLQEFDIKLNYPLTPSNISRNYNYKVWWTINHYDKELNTMFIISWKDTVSNRQRVNSNCPYLSGKRVHPLLNSLQARKPHIATEWHPTKNGNLKPTDVTCNCDKVVWWLKLHYDKDLNRTFELEWPARIDHRVAADGKDNPFLTGKCIHPEFNSLHARFKDIASEWCYEKNGNLKPTQISYGSGKSVFWKCSSCGHIYTAIVSSRTCGKRTLGCPECRKSKYQKFVESILRENNIDYDSEVKLFADYRYDIVIDNLNLLYEIDGEQHFKLCTKFHKTEDDFIVVARRDNLKNDFALNKKKLLLRIPPLDIREKKNKKQIEKWVLDFIVTRKIPEEVIQIYETKNPLSNYPNVARVMNSWDNI